MDEQLQKVELGEPILPSFMQKYGTKIVGVLIVALVGTLYFALKRPSASGILLKRDTVEAHFIMVQFGTIEGRAVVRDTYDTGVIFHISCPDTLKSDTNHIPHHYILDSLGKPKLNTRWVDMSPKFVEVSNIQPH